jgi:hypothetical protein
MEAERARAIRRQHRYAVASDVFLVTTRAAEIDSNWVHVRAGQELLEGQVVKRPLELMESPFGLRRGDVIGFSVPSRVGVPATMILKAEATIAGIEADRLDLTERLTVALPAGSWVERVVWAGAWPPDSPADRAAARKRVAGLLFACDGAGRGCPRRLAGLRGHSSSCRWANSQPRASAPVS